MNMHVLPSSNKRTIKYDSSHMFILFSLKNDMQKINWGMDS